MPICTMSRSLALAGLFIKEQLKEPVALFWMIVSPVATYYLLAYSRDVLSPSGVSYIESTSWFYAYISSSVAFFWIFFLHCREEGKWLYQVLRLHARREAGVYVSAVFGIFACCLDLLRHFLLADLFFFRVL